MVERKTESDMKGDLTEASPSFGSFNDQCKVKNTSLGPTFFLYSGFLECLESLGLGSQAF